jgi:hypothetical protein
VESHGGMWITTNASVSGLYLPDFEYHWLEKRSIEKKLFNIHLLKMTRKSLLFKTKAIGASN